MPTKMAATTMAMSVSSLSLSTKGLFNSIISPWQMVGARAATAAVVVAAWAVRCLLMAVLLESITLTSPTTRQLVEMAALAMLAVVALVAVAAPVCWVVVVVVALLAVVATPA